MKYAQPSGNTSRAQSKVTRAVGYPSFTGRLWLRDNAASSNRHVVGRPAACFHMSAPRKASTRRMPTSPPRRRSDMHCAVSSPWMS